MGRGTIDTPLRVRDVFGTASNPKTLTSGVVFETATTDTQGHNQAALFVTYVPDTVTDVINIEVDALRSNGEAGVSTDFFDSVGGALADGVTTLKVANYTLTSTKTPQKFWIPLPIPNAGIRVGVSTPANAGTAHVSVEFWTV